MTLYAKLAALVAAIVILTGIGWKIHHTGYVAGKAEIQAQWTAERVKLQAEVQAQAESNREVQRAAEKRYTVQGEVREKFIIQTVTEIRHETDNLAVCVLTPGARRLLQRAADCASSDTPASCGADQPMRPASPAR